MPNYIRAYVPGGTFFFTVVAYQRQPLLIKPKVRRAIRQAIQRVRTERSFSIEAVVLLPDHMHMIWTLPPGDVDFSTHWRLIKHWTTRQLGAIEPDPWNPRRADQDPPKTVGQSTSHHTPWQPRFWEHTVRSEDEFSALCDYIHYNPVKHGHARCPHLWPHSSFQRFIRRQDYTFDWSCSCLGATSQALKFNIAKDIVGNKEKRRIQIRPTRTGSLW